MSIKLRQVTTAELAAMVNQGFQNVAVKIAHERAPKNVGNFFEVLEFSNYIDNEMIISVTNARKIDGDDFSFDFDATMFEEYNKQHERAQFRSNKNPDNFLTSREKTKESNTPFSMKEEDLHFSSKEIFYLVENASDFFTYATDVEIEAELLQVKYLVAESKDNTLVKDLTYIGYFAKKQHLGTITETEKRVYLTLLSKQ